MAVQVGGWLVGWLFLRDSFHASSSQLSPLHGCTKAVAAIKEDEETGGAVALSVEAPMVVGLI